MLVVATIVYAAIILYQVMSWKCGNGEAITNAGDRAARTTEGPLTFPLSRSDHHGATDSNLLCLLDHWRWSLPCTTNLPGL